VSRQFNRSKRNSICWWPRHWVCITFKFPVERRTLSSPAFSACSHYRKRFKWPAVKINLRFFHDLTRFPSALHSRPTNNILHLLCSALHSTPTKNTLHLLCSTFKIILISQVNEFVRVKRTSSERLIPDFPVVEAAAKAQIPNLNLVAYLHKKPKSQIYVNSNYTDDVWLHGMLFRLFLPWMDITVPSVLLILEITFLAPLHNPSLPYFIQNSLVFLMGT
jgi:hypothetical protein